MKAIYELGNSYIAPLIFFSICLLSALYSYGQNNASIPHLERQGTAMRMVVKGSLIFLFPVNYIILLQADLNT